MVRSVLGGCAGTLWRMSTDALYGASPGGSLGMKGALDKCPFVVRALQYRPVVPHLPSAVTL